MRPARIAAGAESLLFASFIALLLWIPIPLGSNRAWAWMVLEVAAFVLFACWLVLWASHRVSAPEALKRAWPAWLLLSAWLVLQVAHVIPVPASWIAELSPEAAKMQSLVSDLGSDVAVMTLSVDPQASRVSLLKSLAYAAIFFLTLALLGRRSRIQSGARALVYGALALSIYGVTMHLAGANEEWFGTEVSHWSSASATFANRNHFAGFLEMTLAVGIGLLIAGLSDRRADSWKKFLRLTLDWILSAKMLLRVALCILVIALTTTHSRMGNTAFFASLLIAGTLGIALSRHATRNTVLLLASLVAIDLFIVGSWFGVERLAQRLEQTTMQDIQEREEPAVYAVPLIRDYPVFGSGPGTFYVAFPRYRPPTVALFYSQAHNDYAQFAAESGVLGFAILALFVASSLACALLAQWRRRDPLMRGMSFACLMGVTAILIHSWTDFNLQIPSNAAYFMVLLALGWISLHHDRHGADLPQVRAANG
jgi:putative inorganic carbon (HCO3(-)) transporter